MKTQSSHIPDNHPIIALTHIYHATRPLVWEAFTKPEHLVHWWGPDGFSIEHKSADIRLGGHWEFVMTGPDGKRWPNYIRFTEFSPMDVIAHKHGATNADDPDAFDSRITFIELDNKTKVTMTMTFPTMAARANVMSFGAHELGLQTLAKAEAHLRGMQ